MRRDPRTEFVEHAAGEFAAQGFPGMSARVLMALTASDAGQLTSRELQQQLGVSAAAVSGAVRYLQTLGFVQRAVAPGGRQHVYRLPTSAPWYTATIKRTDGLLRLAAVLREGVAITPEDSPARDRLQEMAEFFAFLDRRMPALLDEWEALRTGREP